MLAAACTLLAAIVPVPVGQQILALERNRTLGNGELAGFLGSDDERTAARAALAIGRTKQQAGIPLVAAHLNDSRAGVRAMSVYAMGLLKAGSHATQIIALLHGDRSSAVRYAAADALERCEAGNALKGAFETRAATALAAALAGDRDPIVRGRAALALAAFSGGSMGEFAAHTLDGALTTQHDPEVRRQVMWTIFRKYAIRVPRDHVTPLLRDADEVVRIEAVRAYGRLNNRDAIAALQPLLHDPSWRVQEQAAESIRALEGKPLTEHLTAIPSAVHVPPARRDAFASLAPVPRPHVEGTPTAPNPSQALYEPAIDPQTALDMTRPAHGAHPRVRIVTTKGNIYVTLYPEWAPLTVANFLNVAHHGYYDGNRWFRIVPDFVVQTGDPNDNGEGDAGYNIGAEENPLQQRSYVISMGLNYDDKTNTPLRDSAGTQYYITLSPQYHLDLDFTVFGAVSSGFEVLGRLVESDRVIRIEQIADDRL